MLAARLHELTWHIVRRVVVDVGMSELRERIEALESELSKCESHFSAREQEYTAKLEELEAELKSSGQAHREEMEQTRIEATAACSLLGSI